MLVYVTKNMAMTMFEEVEPEFVLVFPPAAAMGELKQRQDATIASEALVRGGFTLVFAAHGLILVYFSRVREPCVVLCVVLSGRVG